MLPAGGTGKRETACRYDSVGHQEAALKSQVSDRERCWPRGGFDDNAYVEEGAEIGESRPTTLPRRHLVELRQGGIEVVPSVTARVVRDCLRLVSAWIIEAGGMNGEQIRHRRKR